MKNNQIILKEPMEKCLENAYEIDFFLLFCYYLLSLPCYYQIEKHFFLQNDHASLNKEKIISAQFP